MRLSLHRLDAPSPALHIQQPKLAAPLGTFTELSRWESSKEALSFRVRVSTAGLSLSCSRGAARWTRSRRDLRLPVLEASTCAFIVSQSPPRCNRSPPRAALCSALDDFRYRRSLMVPLWSLPRGLGNFDGCDFPCGSFLQILADTSDFASTSCTSTLLTDASSRPSRPTRLSPTPQHPLPPTPVPETLNRLPRCLHLLQHHTTWSRRAKNEAPRDG